MNTLAMIRELSFAENNAHRYSKQELRTLIRLSKDALERVYDSRKKMKKTTRQKDLRMLKLLVS